MPPPEKPVPRPKPKPKPPKPKPKKLKTAADEKPKPEEEKERDGVPINGGVPALPQPFSSASCATYRLCPPPPAPPATVHLRSGRLPTPLIAVSASLLALSAVLLLALLVRWLIRRRRGQQEQHAPLAAQQQQQDDEDDEESVLGVDTTPWGADGDDGEEEVDSGDVHHVWFIRTKGLDERAIAAIAAVVYDATTKRSCGGAGEDGGACAVCLAEFRDGETLRLLPRCGHAFHRACIDTWLRAHVNCPLCRAPVQVHLAAGDKASATAAWVHNQASEAASHRAAGTEEAERGAGVVAAERAVRRAASMVTIPRRAWPEVAVTAAAASSSAREEDMTGLAKIRRLLKAGVGRSASFSAGTCHRLPTTRSSGPSTAAAGGVNGDESR